MLAATSFCILPKVAGSSLQVTSLLLHWHLMSHIGTVMPRTCSSNPELFTSDHGRPWPAWKPVRHSVAPSWLRRPSLEIRQLHTADSGILILPRLASGHHIHVCLWCFAKVDCPRYQRTFGKCHQPIPHISPCVRVHQKSKQLRYTLPLLNGFINRFSLDQKCSYLCMCNISFIVTFCDINANCTRISKLMPGTVVT